MRILLVLTLFISALLISCNKEDSAQGALMKFINYRFQDGQNRDILIKKSYGKLRDLLTNMSDDDFKKFTKVGSLEKKKFKVILENCKSEICFITYTLKYKDYKTDKKDQEKFNIEVKKIAKLVKVNKAWLIADINNIKTYIDSKEKVDVTDK